MSAWIWTALYWFACLGVVAGIVCAALLAAIWLHDIRSNAGCDK
jgi:hypothetical protein